MDGSGAKLVGATARRLPLHERKFWFLLPCNDLHPGKPALNPDALALPKVTPLSCSERIPAQYGLGRSRLPSAFGSQGLEFACEKCEIGFYFLSQVLPIKAHSRVIAGQVLLCFGTQLRPEGLSRPCYYYSQYALRGRERPLWLHSRRSDVGASEVR